MQAFWEVLAEMTPEERTDFLRFTWARSRMPASGALACVWFVGWSIRRSLWDPFGIG